jgi:hypothetical protein
VATWTVRSRGAGGRGGLAGRIFFTLFCLPFLGLGLWFSFLIARATYQSLRVFTWEEAECAIDAAAVETASEAGGDGEPHRFTVRYRWVAFGREYEGDRYRPGYDGSDDVAEAQRLAARYAPGSTALCYVDPGAPSQAYLARPGAFAPGCFLLFPLLFVLAGAGGIALAWLPRRWLHDRFGLVPAGASRPSISKRAGARFAGPGCLVAFFLVFALVGSAFLVPFFIVPALKVVEARSWRAVPCTIRASEVATHAGDDGATYSVKLLYAYVVEGREIQASRYAFMGGSSSGYEGKARIVERLAPGTETVCYVNPEDPYDAVLERGFTPDFLFGLIPLVFVAVGVGGSAFALSAYRRQRRTKQAPGAPGEFALPPGTWVALAAERASGPVTLEPRAGPWAKLFGTLFVAAFWNGITGVFAWQVIRGWQQGSGDGCATLFLSPFVLVGLLLLVSVPYQILASFNPRPVLTLSRGAVPLGADVRLDWRFRGASGRIRRLGITLEGREEATRRQGKSSHTDRSTFLKLALVDTELAPEIGSGSVTLTIPDSLMHSFASDHNKVVWTLGLKGEIRLWPDVAEEFPLRVLPPEPER